MRSLLVLSLVVVHLSACGGRSPVFPTLNQTPAPNQPAALGLVTIVGTDVILPGSRATYTVTATQSDGNKVPNVTSATWSIDNPAVATIDDEGVLTGQRQGTAIITALYQGKSATHTVWVLSQQSDGANLAISFTPDPVPGFPRRCRSGADISTPTWTFGLSIAETHGIGFRLHTETVNLYDERGIKIYGGGDPTDEYFAANSTVSGEPECVSLGRSPSGFMSMILHGVDDRGNQLVFGRQLRLLPVSGASLGPTRTLFAPSRF